MKYKLEYEVDEKHNEGTAKPIWYIVVTDGQRLVRKDQFPYEIMNRIIGPFISRENAEKHRQHRLYEYGKGSVVYCASGYYSDLQEEQTEGKSNE